MVLLKSLNYEVKILKRILAIITCMVLLVSCAHPLEEDMEILFQSSLDLSQEDRQPVQIQEYHKPSIKKILEKDTLTVGMIHDDRAPFFYYTDDGSMDGLDVEIALGIANSLGVELDIKRSAESQHELFEGLAENKYDMVLSKFSMTPERAMAVSFSTPYVTLKYSFLVNKKIASEYNVSDYPFDYMNQMGALIGVIEGTSYENYILKNFPDADICLYSDASSLIDAVIKGNIFAAVYDEITFVKELMRNHEISLYASIYTIEDLRDYICVAVPYGYDDLLECINAYLMVNCYSYTLDDLIRDFPESFN